MTLAGGLVDEGSDVESVSGSSTVHWNVTASAEWSLSGAPSARRNMSRSNECVSAVTIDAAAAAERPLVDPVGVGAAVDDVAGRR